MPNRSISLGEAVARAHGTQRAAVYASTGKFAAHGEFSVLQKALAGVKMLPT